MILIENYEPYIRVNEASNGIGLASGLPFFLGNSDKSGINTITGQLKVDNRPSGGSLGTYAEQIRANVGLTSGTYIGLDNETHLTVSGSTSLRGTQGVAVVDSGKTLTGGTLNGLYGQVRADGTVAGSSFMAGVYGLVEASTAITASHVTSAWFDSHQANAVTGSHQLVYMTNNGAATLDEMFYIYGGANSYTTFDTVGSGVVAKTGTAATGTPVKVHIIVDGVDYWINAYPTSNN